jgi:hypothetical protein
MVDAQLVVTSQSVEISKASIADSTKVGMLDVWNLRFNHPAI